VINLVNSILLEKNGAVASIFLNEPESLNALSPEMRKDFIHSLLDVEEDDNIRVVIIAGKGKAFCAGGDIRQMEKQATPLENKIKMEIVSKIITQMQRMKKPIIAAVHGYAAGAGFSIALASDLVVAEEGAKFLLAFKKIGLVPDLGAHYFLPRIVGSWKAKQLIWSGAGITAEQGEKLGFVTNLTSGNAYQKAQEIATDLANGPIQAFFHTKSIINQSTNLDLQDVLELESYAQSILKTTNDHKEGINAFREKRSPNFTGN
jgi:2-(1,2-epoxy-1,2-dihydrophenyl)acetyl-CoA isomerase